MEQIIVDIVKPLLQGLPAAAVILAVLLFFPEKIEKWSAMLWKIIGSLSRSCKWARKRAIKHGLQGRVNDFVRRLQSQVHGAFNDKLRLEWVSANEDRSGVLSDGRIILRLRANDPQDHNFVHAAYLYISKCLLKKTKRYLSPPQRDALDVYVTSKLLQEERPNTIGFFLDTYMHPKTSEPKNKTALLVDDFAIVDQAGLFFPLLLQELEYLGDTVFGRRRDDLIIRDVYDVVSFLRPIAQRTVGDLGDLNFRGKYARFGIVIVGKRLKLLTSLDPYIRYIDKALASKEVDTIYVIGRKENSGKIDAICAEFESRYNRERTYTMPRRLYYKDRSERSLQYLVVLRAKNRTLVVPSLAFAAEQAEAEKQDVR